MVVRSALTIIHAPSIIISGTPGPPGSAPIVRFFTFVLAGISFCSDPSALDQDLACGARESTLESDVAPRRGRGTDVPEDR